MRNKKKFLLIITILIFCPIYLTFSEAAFIEQIMIHSKAISLANSVTAYPPGIMAIHYNPAGLSDVREGIVISQGLSLAKIDRTDSFKPDNNFQLQKNETEFFTSYNDPVANSDNKTENSRVYVPFYGKADFPIMISPLPFGISSRPEQSRWTFAYATYAPFALGEQNDSESPVRYQNKSSYLQHLIYSAPAFSYQIADNFSMGFSIGFGQTALGMERDLRSPNELTAALKEIVSEKDGNKINSIGRLGPFDKLAEMNIKMRDDFVYPPSFNVGALWKPLSWLSVGVVYQSPVKADLKGDFKFNYNTDFISRMNFIKDNQQAMAAMFINKRELINNGFSVTKGFNNGPIDLDNLVYNLSLLTKNGESGSAEVEDFEFPERLQIGFLLRPFKKLRLMLDLHWENWSMKQYTVNFDKEIQALKLAKIINPYLNSNQIIYRKDSGENWHMSFGIEYQLKECLSVRAGYENRTTNANEDFFDTFSLPDINFFGAGIGLKLRDGVELDMAMGYMVNSGYIIKDNGSYNLNYLLPTDQNIDTEILNTINPLLNPYTGQHIETKIEAYILSANITIPFETMYTVLDRLF